MSRPAAFSIVRRITALMAVVTLVSLLLHAALVVLVVQPLFNEVTDAQVGQLRALRAALQATAPADRAALAQALAGQGISVSLQRPGGPTPPPSFDGRPPPGLPPPLLERMQAQLGPEVLVEPALPAPGAAPGRHVLQVGVLVDGQRWWLAVPGLNPPSPAAIAPVVGAFALIAAAVALTLIVGVRWITRPMAQLSRDLLDRRDRLRAIPEPAHASVELQEVIRSFNMLVHAVEIADASRRQMLAGLSHDLRTPLSRLQLRVELECSEPVADAMAPDFLALSRIIDQFLAYAQGEVGGGRGRPRRFDELVHELVAEYADTGRPVQLRIESEVPQEVPDLAIRRLLSNLLDNALEHGRAPAEVVLGQRGGAIELTVSDGGEGIRPADLAQAMLPFVKLGGRADPLGHCGLGLAIVNQIVQQLDAELLHLPFDGTRSGLGLRMTSTQGPTSHQRTRHAAGIT